MGKILNIVWEELLPAMQSKALPPAANHLKTLELKTASLRLPVIEGKTTTSISKKISKKSYTLSANKLGIQAIDFQLHKTPHSILLKRENTSDLIPIGNGQYQKSTHQTHLPYTENLHKKIATSGAWISDNVYQLKVYLYEMPESITYTFRFEEDQLLWESKLEHSLLGSSKQEPLLGQR